MSAKVTGWVLEHSPTVGSSRLVLLVLADRADHEGRNAYPSVSSIAQYARCGRSTVHRALRELEESGHIVREGVSSIRTVTYRVVMEPRSSPVDGPGSGPSTVPDRDPQTVPDRDGPKSGRSHLVPVEGPKSGPKPTTEPSIDSLRSSSVDLVFGEWMRATGRDTARTKLTADRRRRIVKALDSHGEEMCLAAVRNIGTDRWAAGLNDRGRPFNDIEHALGTAERIERWAAGPSRPAAAGRRGQPMADSVSRGAEVLRRAMNGGSQ